MQKGRVMHTPNTPLFYSKIGIYMGIYYFLTFALKHRLWIFVRTASLGRFQLVPTIYVLSKNKKNITICHLKINIFTAVTYRNILYGRVIVMHVETISSLFDMRRSRKFSRGRGGGSPSDQGESRSIPVESS